MYYNRRNRVRFLKIFQDNYSTKVVFFEFDKIVFNGSSNLNQARQDFNLQNGSTLEALNIIIGVSKDELKTRIKNNML